MEEEKVAENRLTSAAAFVEGGIQEACNDACSICLEAFCDNDPSTVTSCKHEFHLQCILEWYQRSSQCPMCWQPISLKDRSSQELLDAVEHERNMRMNPPRNTAIFHHPTLGDFELQHLPVNASESELEERIMQHLVAMGRGRNFGRRGHRDRFLGQGPPQFMVSSTDPNGSSARSGGEPYRMMAGESGSNARTSSNRSTARTCPTAQDRVGPSDFSTFSTRYKESITKSTRSWKERIFNCNSTSPEPRNDARNHREANRGSDTGQSVWRMMDHLDIAEYDTTNGNGTTTLNNSANVAALNGSERQIIEAENNRLVHEDDAQTPCAADSTSS